jgi:hypothetical protein
MERAVNKIAMALFQALGERTTPSAVDMGSAGFISKSIILFEMKGIQ